MRRKLLLFGIGAVVATGVFCMVLMLPGPADATSQWSRKTGLACSTCHSAFPRLNAVGENYLKSGFQMMTAHGDGETAEDRGGWFLDEVNNLLGFRLNMTPFMWENNALLPDAGREKQGRITLGNPNWIQFFVAGSIQPDISFFSEMQFEHDSFHFSWFYFTLTNVLDQPALNFQVGNLSPLEFSSYANRLRQLPAVRGEVMRIKTSDGAGEASVNMSSARPGIQYFTVGDWYRVYAGVTPGNGTQVSQFMQYWGGLVLVMPEGMMEGFESSTVTLHAYKGTDSKNTGIQAPVELPQVVNDFYQVSPQVNLRYKDQLDLQFAYVMGKEENRFLEMSPLNDFDFNGFAFTGGYMPTPKWHYGVQYDWYESDNLISGTDTPVLSKHRVVPALSYFLNENIRATLYYERDLSGTPSDDKIDKVMLNIRTMF